MIDLNKFSRKKDNPNRVSSDVNTRARIDHKKLILTMPLNGMERKTHHNILTANRQISSTLGEVETNLLYDGHTVKIVCTAYYTDK
jgi:predicted RNA-binding protein Jag